LGEEKRPERISGGGNFYLKKKTELWKKSIHAEGKAERKGRKGPKGVDASGTKLKKRQALDDTGSWRYNNN